MGNEGIQILAIRRIGHNVGAPGKTHANHTIVYLRARRFQKVGNPLHFAGVNIGAFETPSTAGQASSTAWFQHGWQDNDRISREEVARAIRSAENDMEEMLGYRLLPSWDQDEWIPTTRPFRRELININDRDVRGRWQNVQPRWGYFLSGGIRAKESLGLAETIAWSSTKPPAAYNDTGTVSVATTVTDPAEIRLYYPGKEAADEWEIRPINVTISGGIATITFNREPGGGRGDPRIDERR